MSVTIKIKNAVKKYGNTTIISDLSLRIKEGEFFTLLGPSGCGKTTLLRMIAGFNSIEGGDFYFNDKRINDMDPAKRNIGMVFQNYAIFPNMTVEKNVAFGLKNRKLPAETIKEQKVIASVRPEEFVLSDKANEGLRATIDDSVFLGLNTHYYVHLDNGDNVEIIQESKIDNIIPKGSTIWLTVKKEKINIFVEDGSENIVKGVTNDLDTQDVSME